MLDPSAVPSAVPSPAGTEPVHVRTEPVDGVSTPTQLLRGGRLWVVRSAERLAGPGKHWRVGVTPAPGVAPVALELGLRDGQWFLAELAGTRVRG
ncbi:hypothetical protein GCM10009616_39650 [Microlunatus lacustris]